MSDKIKISAQGTAYVEWVTSLDTEPPLDGAFAAGWKARDAEIERLTLADRQWADHVKRLSEENERLQARVQALQECFDLAESEA
jgi:hypothetical protein